MTSSTDSTPIKNFYITTAIDYVNGSPHLGHATRRPDRHQAPAFGLEPLAEGSERQRAIAREMADFISPRPGFTQHPLTIHAADHMTHSVERAERFRRREETEV